MAVSARHTLRVVAKAEHVFDLFSDAILRYLIDAFLVRVVETIFAL